MIDWIHGRCREWGYQVHKINLGNQGWPPRTVMDKLIKEGILGAAFGRFMQNYPECLTEDALKTNNAIKRLSERDREIIFIVYVVREKSKVTMARYSLLRTAYYDWIDEVHKRIASSLISICEQNSQNCRQIPTQDFVYS